MQHGIQTKNARHVAAGLVELSTSSNTAVEIELSKFAPSPFEPQARRRAKFDEGELRELGQSIKQHGLAQPIVARIIDAPGKPLQIVFGERRWLASRLAGLETILCFVRDYDDAKVIELQYEENHRRQKNDPLDDAYYFKYLKEREGYSDEDLADRLNTTAVNVRDKLKLNDLIDEAKEELSADQLPLKHAYYLSRFTPETQRLIVKLQLAYKYNDRTEKPVSFDMFRDEVEETIVRRLDSAPFDTTDPRLHVTGRVCAECPENSAYNSYLFPEYAKEASCLNKPCFELKTNTHLRLQREAIAAQIPNPTNVPIEEVIASVPLVTNRKDVSERTPFRNKVLTSQTYLNEPECEFSATGLDVDGDLKGQPVYFCRNDECPVHHPKPPETALEDLSDVELTQYEIDFDKEVERRVRLKILGAAMEWFDHYKSFWAFDDLIKNLIASVLFERASASDGALDDVVLQIVRGLKNAPRNFKDRDRIREFVKTLDKTNQSRILFLLSAAGADEVEFLKIAADYTTLNFLHLDAETRLELAPPVFRAKAQEYLDAVRSGNICDVPRLSRTAGSYDFVETVFDDAK